MGIALKLTLGLAVLGLGALPLNRDLTDPPEAELALDREDDQLVITGLYMGSAEMELTYQLDVSKSGTAGSTTSRQGGSFTPTLDVDSLSTVRVGIAPGDEVHAVLRVTDDDDYIVVVEHRETID